MELIEDLGMKPNGSGNKYRVCLYMCPQCKTKVELYAHNVKKQKGDVCSTCEKINRNTTHGLSHEKFYQTWNGMKGRCYRKRDTAYKNYGGRGISICEEWHDANTFKEWFDNNHIEGMQIDRIDNDGNYSPDNCRFISASENINNSRPKLNKVGKYRYVVWHKASQMWRAIYKGTYIGSHKDEEEAFDMLENFKGNLI